jgi:hypothetical protein
VVDVVHRLDDAWLHGEAHAMSDDLHASVVVLLPGSDDRIEGRNAVIDHYRAFIAEGRPVAWSERDLTADVVGTTAVVRYHFELEREVEDATRAESGRHLWVLTRDNDRWLAAWRTTSLDDTEGTPTPRSTGHRT